MSITYQRRKCSQNVYFLEKSRQRGSEPILKEIQFGAENVSKWGSSTQKNLPLTADKNTLSMTTLRIPATTGYDWRRDTEDGSENSFRGVKITPITNLRQNIIEEIKIGPSKPISPKSPQPQPQTPRTKQQKQTLEEQNRRLKEMINQCSNQNRILKGQNERLQKQEKDFEEQIRHRNRRIDEVEKEKWNANNRLRELEHTNQEIQERFRNSIDPSDFEALRRKVEMLELIQQELQKQIMEDGLQYEKGQGELQQGSYLLRGQ